MHLPPNRVVEPYGGDWTIVKLVVNKKYSSAFTRILRDKPQPDRRFTLWYFDGLAGSGEVRIKAGRFAGRTVKGSARLALEVENRQFDKIRLVDSEQENVTSLERLLLKYPARDARVTKGDVNELVNEFLTELSASDRAVVFLDPFRTEVAWSTVESIAKSKKCDVLLMFPAFAVRRMLRRMGGPDARLIQRLDKVFGTRSWKDDLYHAPEDPVLSDEFAWLESDKGFEAIVSYYRDRLRAVYERVVPLGFPLLRDRMRPGTQIFELMFAASNPSGAALATKVAESIMKKAMRDTEDLLAEADELVVGTWDDALAPESPEPDYQPKLL